MRTVRTLDTSYPIPRPLVILCSKTVTPAVTVSIRLTTVRCHWHNDLCDVSGIIIWRQ